MDKFVSIIVPCFNEEEALPIYYKTAKPILESITSQYELILIDDGSKDNTPKLIKELAANDNHVKYVIFSRNFGKEAAMYAGLEKSKGEYVAIMDADLQDPPEKLKEMYDLLETGEYDCIATRRVTRAGEPKIRSFLARMFYKLVNKHTQTEIVDGARDFRLMKRKMVDSILSMKEYNRFSKGIFSFVGYRYKWLEYENIERCAGETKWNIRKLFVYALEGIVAFTLAPLYAVVKFGLALGFLDFIAFVILLILHLTHVIVFGWPLILLLSMILLTSFMITCLGIMAIYQAKSYNEVKQRPLYFELESNIK